MLRKVWLTMITMDQSLTFYVVQKARENSAICIVSVQWLYDSLQEDTLCNETRYLMSNIVPSSENIITIEPSETEKEPKIAKAKKRDQVANASDVPSAKKQKGKQADEEAPGPAAGAVLLSLADAFVLDKASISKEFKEQKVRTAGLAVPLDEGCPLEGSHKVHIDEDGTVYDVSLNQTNVGANNNKFYRIQVWSIVLRLSLSLTFGSSWFRMLGTSKCGRVGVVWVPTANGKSCPVEAFRVLSKHLKASSKTRLATSG